MNYQKSFALVLALLALVCNFNSKAFAADTSKKSNNQPAQAAEPVVKKAIRVDQTQVSKTKAAPVLNIQDNDRYTVVKPYKFHPLSEFKQPVYTGPETVKDLVEKSAPEIGMVNALVVNEATHVGVEVNTKSAAKFLVDKEFGIPLYLVGCMDRNGKPFYNRIMVLKKNEKPVAVETVPVTTPSVTPAPTPVVQVTPAPTPTAASTLPYDENQGVYEVKIKNPTTNFVDEVDAGYDVRFKGGKGNIAVVPAIEVDQTLVVVDIPKPTVRANGRKMPLGGE